MVTREDNRVNREDNRVKRDRSILAIFAAFDVEIPKKGLHKNNDLSFLYGCQM